MLASSSTPSSSWRGFQKVVAVASKMTIAGQSMTQPQIVAEFQGLQKLYTDVEEAHTALRQKVLDRIAGLPAARLFIEAAVKTEFGLRSP